MLLFDGATTEKVQGLLSEGRSPTQIEALTEDCEVTGAFGDIRSMRLAQRDFTHPALEAGEEASI
ncbi:MAG: hypothetical protein ACOC4K_02260 [Verrucomicrobiota bacterium]